MYVILEIVCNIVLVMKIKCNVGLIFINFDYMLEDEKKIFFIF